MTEAQRTKPGDFVEISYPDGTRKRMIVMSVEDRGDGTRSIVCLVDPEDQP